MRVPGLRALYLFWAAVIFVAALGVGTLALLGPPETMVAEAPAADPPAAAPATPPQAAAPEPPPVAQPPPATPAAQVTPPPQALPPAAPEPPPLAAAEARRAASEPVIAPPDERLLEPTRHGPVPTLGPDNRSSIRTYARAFDRDDRRPRIGIIINNIGLFAQHSEEAIRRLPGAVTLAFSPYALRPEPLVDRARARGMEMLVALPLEPQGYGQTADPGERALLTGLSGDENRDRLDWVLSRIQGYVGTIGGLGGMRGERYAANPELLAALQAALTQHGLLYIDPRPGAPQPARAFGRSVDVLLDEPSAVRAEVERRLAELEALAQGRGTALGLANDPAPSVVAAIASWSSGIENRGLVLAPVTVLIRRPSQAAER